MFRVKVIDIQKIKPNFKEDMVQGVLLSHNIGNGEKVDFILLTTEEVIQVSRNNLMLLQSTLGYLDLENELLACYDCVNSFSQNAYSFEIVPIKEENDVETRC